MKEKLAYNKYFEMTQKEVGDVLGISPVMINDIEQRAKAKIRKILASKGIKASDLIEAKQ